MSIREIKIFDAGGKSSALSFSPSGSEKYTDGR